MQNPWEKASRRERKRRVRERGEGEKEGGKEVDRTSTPPDITNSLTVTARGGMFTILANSYLVFYSDWKFKC